MSKLSVVIFILLFFGMVIQIGFCEEGEEASDNLSFIVLPVLTYSSDTGFGAGLTALKFYNPSRIRISSVQSYFVFTQKKQVIALFVLDHYFSNNAGRFRALFEYSKFPTYFYGMGNNTSNSNPEKYTPEYFSADSFYEHRFKKHFRIKPQFFVRNHSLVKSETNGIIRSRTVPWHGGRLDIGTGISLLWDTRDNLIATRRGTLAQIEYKSSVYQDEGRGFHTVSCDVRYFYNPLSDVVFGSMVSLKDSRGDVPFYMLSKLGGNDRLRGYELERFRDKSLVLFQHDFRYPIWGPIGGAVFVATGRVADRVSKLFSGRYHTGYGAGLRLYVNREDNLVFRFDAARGSDSKGYYIWFGEAF